MVKMMTIKMSQNPVMIINKVNTFYFLSWKLDEGDKNKRDDDEIVDLTKYKGIYYNDDNKKFQDDETGAHFEYIDLCKRLDRVLYQRRK